MSRSKEVSPNLSQQKRGDVRSAGISGFSSPIYRGRLNHSASAELQEGYRILTGGQKANIISDKDLFKAIHSCGLHTSEEEVNDLLRVVHQDERTLGLEFPEFMMLMTKGIDEASIAEMRRPFSVLDKAKTGVITKKQFTELFVSSGEHSSAEELEELMLLAETSEELEVVDYNKLINELAILLNKM
uniref:EF-hand protein 5 n=1 Tax=Leishmania tarentolae TaxID=5689 RepID=EFH5_LEITA|nr:RecName: Full=EF-hand protein 5; Short=EFH5 [Leishmania tarentolae]CAA48769.1 EFH5 [Leishmania tarentolae]